jgi:putative addiction module component (TIGR02574 family)
MGDPSFDFTRLTVSERIQLAEDLWDSVRVQDAELTLTDAQSTELDRRLDDLAQEPGAAGPWGEVRSRIEGRLSQDR